MNLDSVISTGPRIQGFGPFSKKGERKQTCLGSLLDLKYFGPTEEKYETGVYCRLEFQPLNEGEHGRAGMRLKVKVCLGRVVQETARFACACVCACVCV